MNTNVSRKGVTAIVTGILCIMPIYLTAVVIKYGSFTFSLGFFDLLEATDHWALLGVLGLFAVMCAIGVIAYGVLSCIPKVKMSGKSFLIPVILGAVIAVAGIAMFFLAVAWRVDFDNPLTNRSGGINVVFAMGPLFFLVFGVITVVANLCVGLMKDKQ